MKEGIIKMSDIRSGDPAPEIVTGDGYNETLELPDGMNAGNEGAGNYREVESSYGHDAEERRSGKPRIGDTRPAPQPTLYPPSGSVDTSAISHVAKGTSDHGEVQSVESPVGDLNGGGTGRPGGTRKRSRGRRGGHKGATSNSAGKALKESLNTGSSGAPDKEGSSAELVPSPVGLPLKESGSQPRLSPAKRRRRRGKERAGLPLGRYLMLVHVTERATQIAVLEGRALVEHYLSWPSDEISQIDGNIYLGRVQSVLPGMEAAFIDIGTPKNAVLYRGDVRYDKDDLIEEGRSTRPRIEDLLRQGQTIICQVTKNPIGAKGARLTQEVSLPGRFVVLVPNSTTFGISKRLDDAERKRLRRIVEDLRGSGHGIIVRTAAEGVSAEEIHRDVDRLIAQWEAIDAAAKGATAPELLYREPDVAIRVIREELTADYRGILIDDESLYTQVRRYVEDVNPELAERVQFYDPAQELLPLFERYHVQEQLHKALDRKVWLPSGGSIIIERTEALTVIDVNTGKNVGSSNLEETVYRNNLEAAEEIARQLRLRDIGGIIVVDFIDMELKANRESLSAAFRAALARDKTITRVYEISELGLVEMTRKRISEGLVESFSEPCAACGGRGIVLDESLL